MSVAQILQQMSETVGRAARERGAIWGNVIQSASNVPGQILADREKHALLLRQQAQQDATAGYARNADARATNADARATKDQALQDDAAQRALDHKRLINAALTAARGEKGDPNQFDSQAALATLTQGGEPTALHEVWAAHQSTRPVITQQDPTKDTYENGVLTRPGVAKPPDPSPAGFAATMNDPTKTPEQRAAAKLSLEAMQQTPGQEETVRHNTEMEKIGRMTAGREIAAQQETARHNRVTEAAANPLGPGGDGLSGADLLAKLSPDQRAQAQGLVDGRRSLDARLAATPNGRSIISGAYALDPSFDQTNYNSRNKTRADFTSGASAKNVNALNTVIGHLGDLSQAADGLKNTWSPTWNSIANAVSSGTGNAAVKTFETIQNAVADEATRVWRQAGGTEADIKSWKKDLDSAGSPEQLHGVIATIGDLLNSKLDALQEQQRQGMGTAAVTLLAPKSAETLARLRTKAGGDAGVAPTEGATKPIDGHPGTEQTYTNGKWIRTK